VDNDFVILMI